MKAKILKMLALAEDPRTPVGERNLARARLEELAAKHGIDLKTIKDDVPVELVVRYDKRRIRFAGRLAASLAGDFYGVAISFDFFFVGQSRLVFKGIGKDRLQSASNLLFEVERAILGAYRDAKSDIPMIRRKFGFQPLLCKRSYMTGYFNGLKERIREEAETEARREERRKARQSIAQLKKADHTPEKSRPPEPPNPFALAIVEKPKPKPKATPAPAAEQNETASGAEEAARKRRKIDHTSYGAGLIDGKQKKLKYVNRNLR